MPILERYLNLLATQMEFDAKVFNTTWVIVTFFPFVIYGMMAMLKWFILLAPITFPISLAMRKLIPKNLIPWLKDSKQN